MLRQRTGPYREKRVKFSFFFAFIFSFRTFWKDKAKVAKYHSACSKIFFSHMAISIQNHLRFSNCRTDVRRESHGDMRLRLRKPLFWQVLVCSTCIIFSLRVTFDLFILFSVNQSYRPCGTLTWQADKLFILWRSQRRTKPRTIIIPDGPSARPIIDFPSGWTECEANNWLSKWMDRVQGQ